VLDGDSNSSVSDGTDQPKPTDSNDLARLWRLVFGASLLAGVVQIAMIRELSAYHALSSVNLSIRLVIAVVIAAYGLGAALAPAIGRIGEGRALAGLGAGIAVYLIALLLAALWWLEPGLSARAVDAPRLLLLGALVSPPFVACGMVTTHVTAAMQQRSPLQIGSFIGLSLVGTLVGVIISHHYAQWIGVNSLMVLAAGCALPLLLDRPIMACAIATLIAAVPLESWLEAKRETRPEFYAPVTTDNTTRVFSGWSPHQKVDLYTFRDEILLGCYNGFWQWWVAARTDHPHAFPGYDLLYDSDWVKGRDVLVIGSGAGMGLLHLEQSQPRSITAVELDPLVVELSSGPFSKFNDHVYERVEVHAMDGRSFLEATTASFDVIIYEGSFLTAAHPQVAVGVENYLYTREGIAAALDRLRPDGLGIVLFAGPSRSFARVRAAVEDHGVPSYALQLSYAGTLWREMPVLLFGHNRDRVQRAAETVLSGAGRGRAQPYPSEKREIESITDARPFLYAGERDDLRPLAWLVGSGALALVVGLVVPGRRRLRGYYFLIGVSFMLVQYGVVSTFRSFFGDPVTTAYAVVLLLLGGMAVGSARLRSFLVWPRWRRYGIGAAALLVSGAALALLPVDLALLPGGFRLLVAALTVVPGAVLLGVLFPLGLRGQPREAVVTAYVFDALGTVVGFLLFYLVALLSGIPVALGAGLLGYAAAWVILPRP
jgi:SAM-dependent methyltransferase